MGVDRVMNATPPCKAVTPVACDYVLTTEEDEEDLFVDEAARSFPSTPATVAQKGRSPSPSDSECAIPVGWVASVRVDDAPVNGVVWYRVVTRTEDGDCVADAHRRYGAFRTLRDRLQRQSGLGPFETRFPSRFGSKRPKQDEGFDRTKREVLLENWLNEALGPKRASLDPSSLRTLREFVGADGASPKPSPEPSPGVIAQISEPIQRFFNSENFEVKMLRAENAALTLKLDAALADQAASAAMLEAVSIQKDFILAELARTRNQRTTAASPFNMFSCCGAGQPHPITRRRPTPRHPAPI